MPSEIIIFEVAHLKKEQPTLITQNLKMVDFKTISNPEREFLLSAIQSNQISAFTSPNFRTNITPTRSIIYYQKGFLKSSIILKKRKKTDSKAYTIDSVQDYCHYNSSGSSCLGWLCLKLIQFVYKIAKLAIILAFFIILYILFFLSKLKWPKFSDKDEKKDDDKKENNCCGCEEIDANNAKFESEISGQINSARSAQATGDMTMSANLLGIENAVRTNKRNMPEDKANPKFDEMKSKMDQEKGRLEKMINEHPRDCFCDRLTTLKYDFKNYLRELCKKDVKGCQLPFVDYDTVALLEQINDLTKNTEFKKASEFSNKILIYLSETEKYLVKASKGNYFR